MNQKLKEKQVREDFSDLNSFMWDNELKPNADTKMFEIHYLTWRRVRCCICEELINLGEYLVYSKYKFFGGYSKTANMHLKCLHKTMKREFDEMENYVKYHETNINDKDFNIKELDKIA